MKIIFAGDSIIKVTSEVIEVTLDDQGEAWDTKINQNTKLYNVQKIKFKY